MNHEVMLWTIDHRVISTVATLISESRHIDCAVCLPNIRESAFVWEWSCYLDHGSKIIGTYLCRTTDRFWVLTWCIRLCKQNRRLLAPSKGYEGHRK
jgi:hypothetical protein